MRYLYIKNGDVVDQMRRSLADRSSRGGPEAFLTDFVEAHRDDDVLILCRATRNEQLDHGRLRVRSFASGEGGVGGFFPSLRSAVAIGRAMLQWKAERILCGGRWDLLWVSMLVARLTKTPIVCSRHTGLSERAGIGHFIDRVTLACIRACVGVVCHGPYLREQVIEAGLDPSRVFEFDVDLRDFASRSAQPVPDPLRSFKARFGQIIMYLGRIQTGKGVFDLLEAFDGVSRQSDVSVGLVYVGEGRDAGQLEQETGRRGLGEKVLRLGKVPHDSIADVLRCATVVTTPTRPPLIEGRCMVALESFAVGVPVIAPSYAAFPYVVKDNVNGLLFEVGNVSALRECIVRVARDTGLRHRLAEGAHRTAADLLTVRHGFAQAVDLAFRAGSRAPG